MPVSGSIEKAPWFGYLDSEPFLSASSLNAHLLRTMFTNANHLFTQPQCVLRQVWRAQSWDGDVVDMMGWGAHSLSVIDFWQLVMPPTAVPKQPGIRELDFRIRLKLDPNRIAMLQMTSYTSPFQERPAFIAGSSVFYVTGTGSEQLLTGTVSCRIQCGEQLGLYIKGEIDPTFDHVAEGFGTAADAVVSSSFDYGPPTRFMPTKESSAGGIDGNLIPNSGTYVVFTESGSNNIVHGPAIIISGSKTKGKDYNRQSLFCLPPTTHDLSGKTYKVFDSINAQFISVCAFTKERMQ